MGSRADGAPGKLVVMLCTAGLGGMRAVVEGYKADGLFDRYPIRWLKTNCDESLWQRLKLWVRAYLSLCMLLLRGRVAALHSHMAMRGSFWRKSAFNRTARLFGVPVLAHLHGSEFREFFAAQPRWRQRLITAEFERCQRVLVLSESWALYVRSIAPSARVTVLRNYVRVPELPAQALRGHAPVQLLFLGEIGTRKGIYDLLPALRLARMTAPEVQLRIGGSGEVDKAKAAAQTHAVHQHVEFLGWVSGADKFGALRSADIYVLPSHNEGMPISILEAMAQGLPIIATRVGGIPELVRDGIDGMLVNAGDVEALAQVIAGLALDPARRARMGESARNHVLRHFSDAAVLPELYGYYDELLNIDRSASISVQTPE